MIVDVNQSHLRRPYLDSLNRAFGAWGDEALYDWVFNRTAGSHLADQIVLSEGGGLLAGSGVSYRKIRSGNQIRDVGIMTGSWTLPAARGRGCFSRIIEESVRLCRERSCSHLLAFVAHDNASRRRLEAAGSVMVPSTYSFSSAERVRTGSLPVAEVDIEAADIWQQTTTDRELDQWREGEQQRNVWHFWYPSLADFVGQCIDRAQPTHCLRVGGATAVIERTAEVDRVVTIARNGETTTDVITSLAAHAHAHNRRFFSFSIGTQTFGGCDSKQGFLTILPVDSESPELLGPWRIDAGDRM